MAPRRPGLGRRCRARSGEGGAGSSLGEAGSAPPVVISTGATEEEEGGWRTRLTFGACLGPPPLAVGAVAAAERASMAGGEGEWRCRRVAPELSVGELGGQGEGVLLLWEGVLVCTTL